MKLAPVKSAVSSSFIWSAKTEQTLQAATWVKLRELPSPYSYDEALLLCQHSDTEWVVWIPDHGEMILHRCQLGETC
jgi:hypothetical protein